MTRELWRRRKDLTKNLYLTAPPMHGPVGEPQRVERETTCRSCGYHVCSCRTARPKFPQHVGVLELVTELVGQAVLTPEQGRALLNGEAVTTTAPIGPAGPGLNARVTLPAPAIDHTVPYHYTPDNMCFRNASGESKRFTLHWLQRTFDGTWFLTLHGTRFVEELTNGKYRSMFCNVHGQQHVATNDLNVALRQAFDARARLGQSLEQLEQEGRRGADHRTDSGSRAVRPRVLQL